MENRNYVQDALLGVAVGDALGVPVEFVSRKGLINNPVVSMRAYGTHGQPAGTWSDDSSLTFCLAEMLCKGYDLQELGNRFVNWKHYDYWTPHGQVFDIGETTAWAIDKLGNGVEPTMAGGGQEQDNGNGSLMRIMPLLFYVKNKTIDERFRIVKEISSLTHRHIRSVISCFIYIEFAIDILKGMDKEVAYNNTCNTVNTYLYETDTCTEAEKNIFNRILSGTLSDRVEDEIHSSGYVLSTLEASIWCILKTDNYKDAVLKAVNLRHDTDTTGAVTGGLAGLLYGWETIPAEWLDVLARKNDIEDLGNRLHKKIYG